jgi:hypothetical protein
MKSQEKTENKVAHKPKEAAKQKKIVKKKKSNAKPLAEKTIQTAKSAGRPTKFTDEVTSKILMAIRAGNYVETAAAWAGINKDTFYEWLKLGAKETKGKYRTFSDAVGEALAYAEVNDLMHIGNAAKDNWQAAAWRLERRNPTRWGRREYTENKHNIEIMSKEHLDQVLGDI